MENTLSVVSGILFAIGLIPTLISLWHKKIQPVMASWLVWAIIDTLILLSLLAEHALNGQIVGATIGMWSVVIFIFRFKTTKGWTLIDKFCFCFSILGIVLWQIFQNPTIGLIVGLCAIIISTIPTFISIWQDPARENKFTWPILWLSCIFNVMSVEKWNFKIAAQPIIFLILETIIVLLLYRKGSNR